LRREKIKSHLESQQNLRVSLTKAIIITSPVKFRTSNFHETTLVISPKTKKVSFCDVNKQNILFLLHHLIQISVTNSHKSKVETERIIQYN